MPLLDILKRAQEGIRLATQETDDQKRKRLEKEARDAKRQKRISKTTDNLTTVGRGVLEPIARTLANFGTNVIGGALKESRQAKKGEREDDDLRKLPAPVAGSIRGIIEGEGLTPKHTVFEEAGPSVGLEEGTLPALALGLAGEIAIPGPGGEGRAARKLQQAAKKNISLYKSLTAKPKTTPEKGAFNFFAKNLRAIEAKYTGRINERYGTKAGNVVSTDEAKYVVPDFDATRSADYEEPASGFAKYMRRKLLDNQETKGKPVMLLSGGTGSGKTSALRTSSKLAGAPLDDYAMVHSTNLNKFDTATQEIDEALASGRPVNIFHVYRDPLESFVNGVVPRVADEGRIVPVEAHIKAHATTRETLARLQKHYKTDKRVSFNVVDNSRGLEKSAVVDIDELPKSVHTTDELRQRIYAELNTARQKGRITDAQVETFLADPAGGGAGARGLDGVDTIKGAKSTDAAGRGANYIDYSPKATPLSMEGIVTDVPRAAGDSADEIALKLAQEPDAKRVKFKKGDEFGKGVRIPVTVKRAVPLPDDMRMSYQAREVLDPHDATTSEVFIEMDLAEAGQRLFINDPTGPGGEVKAIPSTFPEWIPAHLRSRKLIDAVNANWPAMPPARNVRQRELYDVAQNEINKRLGVDITINTDGVADDAGQELVNTVGRHVGTDMTFEGQTSVFRQRAIGDEAEKFNKLFDKQILKKNADYQRQKEIVFNKNANTPEVVPGTPVAGRLSVMQELIASPDVRDVGNLRKQGANIDRVFRKVFGQHYELARNAFLDPLDDAKHARVRFIQSQQKSLRSEVVDRFGIKKKSKMSAEVQRYGEGKKDYEALVRDHGAKKAADIVEASSWFRAKYDQFIDDINVVRAQLYPGQPDKLIPKRKEYFRHFREMSGVEGIKNLFETPAGIDPSLEGLSAYTKPNSKWQSIFQQRRGPETVEDAVGGFLDYIDAAGHSLHIDPQIKKMNQLREAMINVTANPGVPETYKKLNNFVRFLEFYNTQSLAGKTGLVDRAIMENVPLGRQGLNIIHYVNSNIKASIIMGKFSSVLAQVFNMPQGIVEAGEVASTKASLDMVSHVLGKNEAMDASKFLLERYDRKLTRSFNERLIEQPTRFMEWMLEIGDEMATRFMWAAQYRKGLADGIADPVRNADVITRNLVGGRGLGEVPLIQRDKSFRVVAPFTLEMGNFWWVVKDQMDAKQYTKLVKLMAYNWLFNSASEAVTGRRIVFDPIDALWDAANSEDKTTTQRAGRLAGEFVGNVPGGAQVAQLFISTPEGREAFFGDEDPTRFGTGFGVLGVRDLSAGQVSTKALGAIGVKGVKQVETSIKGVSSVIKGEGTSRTGRTQFPMKEIVKPVIFGKYSTKAARAYFDLDLQPLGDRQSEVFRQHVDQGADPNKTFYVFHRQRIESNVEKKRNELETSADFTNAEKLEQYKKVVASAQKKLTKLGNALDLSDSDRRALREIEIDIPDVKKPKPTLKLPVATP